MGKYKWDSDGSDRDIAAAQAFYTYHIANELAEANRITRQIKAVEFGIKYPKMTKEQLREIAKLLEDQA